MLTDNAVLPPPSFDRDRITRGVAVFAALSILGYGLLWAFSRRGEAAQAFSTVSSNYLALATLAMVADLLIGAVRYQIFLVRIRPGCPFWVPIKADLATRFMGAVTPMQTGGGPAQIFVLWREGIPVPASLSFLMINLLSTMIFFLGAGGVTTWWMREQFSSNTIQALVTWGFVSFVMAFLLILTGLVRPDVLARLLTPMVRRLEASPRGWVHTLARGGRAVIGSVERYREACVEFTREAPWLPVMSLVLTTILYFNKFVLGYFIVRGLGVDAAFWPVIATQALVHFVLFIIPTPGAAGFAEVGTGAIMSMVMPVALLTPFSLAQRFLLYYVPAAAGSVVLARAISPGSSHEPDTSDTGTADAGPTEVAT